MSAILVVRLSYADQITAYMSKKQIAVAVPDLGLLSDITHLEKAGIIF